MKEDRILIKVYKDSVIRCRYVKTKFGKVTLTKTYQREDVSDADLEWSKKQGYQVIYIN